MKGGLGTNLHAKTTHWEVIYQLYLFIPFDITKVSYAFIGYQVFLIRALTSYWWHQLASPIYKERSTSSLTLVLQPYRHTISKEFISLIIYREIFWKMARITRNQKAAERNFPRTCENEGQTVHTKPVQKRSLLGILNSELWSVRLQAL